MQFKICLVFCFLLLITQHPSLVFAQDSNIEAKPAVAISQLTDRVDSVRSHIDQVAASVQKLDEDGKQAIDEKISQAKSFLKLAETSLTAAQKFNQQIDNAPQLTKSLRHEIASQDRNVSNLNNSQSIDELRIELSQLRKALKTTTDELLSLAIEPSRRQKRLASIPNEISAIQAEFDDTQPSNGALANTAFEENVSPTQQVQNVLQDAKALSLEARLRELEEEQSYYAATSDLLVLQTEVAEAQRDSLETQIGDFSNAIQVKLEQRTADSIARLREAYSELPVNLKTLGERNLELLEKNAELTSSLDATTEDLDSKAETLNDLRSTLKITRERIDTVGLTEAIGVLLRSQRKSYDDLRNRMQSGDSVDKDIQKQQALLFVLEDELRNVQSQLRNFAHQTLTNQAFASDPTSSIASSRHELLTQQRALIQQAIAGGNSLLQNLLTMDTQNRQLVSTLNELDSLIDENLFWIRSVPSYRVQELSRLPSGASWFTERNNWKSAIHQFKAGYSEAPLTSLVLLFSIVALALSRPYMAERIQQESGNATRVNTTIGATCRTFAYTLARGMFWSFVFFSIYVVSSKGWNQTDFTRGLAKGALLVSIYLASREWLREACVDKGLADTHFGWTKSIILFLRKHLAWYSLLGASCIFMLGLMHQHPNPLTRIANERTFTLLLFVLMAIFHGLVLHPTSPVYTQVRILNDASRVYKYRTSIWIAFILLPLSLSTLAIIGYLDSTYLLDESIQISFVWLLSLLLIVGVLFRWLSLHRRNIARQEAQQAREKHRAIQESSSAAQIAELGIEVQDDELNDLPSLDRQTRRSIVTLSMLCAIIGLLFIWRDVLPAIQILDRVTLWTVGIGESLRQVTLRDVLFSLIGIVVSVFAVRNLPGVFELLVLRRSSLDSGAKYAWTTLLRYATTIVGLFVALHFLSVPWTQLSWLLAAVSVGLGFGLQEIVANFVSGIILLLERPIRVGDVVSIGNTTGIVSRIQMRATTVTSWDRRNLVVPNKDLVTEKVLNWSLANVLNRIELTVGVDYNVDPDHVRSVLTNAVVAHPEVLSEPKPVISFEQFGDSALIFTVRFFVSTLDYRYRITHEINTLIYRALHEEGISIPYPQQDLHVQLDRSMTEWTARSNHENS